MYITFTIRTNNTYNTLEYNKRKEKYSYIHYSKNLNIKELPLFYERMLQYWFEWICRIIKCHAQGKRSYGITKC